MPAMSAGAIVEAATATVRAFRPMRLVCGVYVAVWRQIIMVEIHGKIALRVEGGGIWRATSSLSASGVEDERCLQLRSAARVEGESRACKYAELPREARRREERLPRQHKTWLKTPSMENNAPDAYEQLKQPQWLRLESGSIGASSRFKPGFSHAAR
ncbi:unnamed protein product [Lampetra planeri]